LEDHKRDAKKLLKFLEYIDTQKEKLNGEPSCYNSYIETYRQFLRLKAKYPDVRLIPSDEVEWVWYCHIVRPKFYIAYCEKNFQKLILHEIDDWFAGHEDPTLLDATATLYEKEYGQKYLFTSLPILPSKEIKYLETADVYNDWNWYSVIIKCPNYPFDLFLDEGHQGYQNYLQSVHSSGFRMGPPINIDLWWHTHQIFPQIYVKDCMEMFGEVIFHTPLGTVGQWQEFQSHLTEDAEKWEAQKAKEKEAEKEAERIDAKPEEAAKHEKEAEPLEVQ